MMLTHARWSNRCLFLSFISITFSSNSFFRCEENKIGFFWCKRKRERRITITFFVDFGSLLLMTSFSCSCKRLIKERDILWLHFFFSKVKNQILCVLLASVVILVVAVSSLYSVHSVLHHRPEQEEDLNDLERPKERLSRGMIFCEDSVRFLSFSCSQRRSLLKANPGQSSRCLRRWTLWCLMTQETCLSSSLLVSPAKHARRKSQNLRCINCVPDSSLIALLFYSLLLS